MLIRRWCRRVVACLRLIAQGGAFAGWCLYLLDGKPKFCHNFAGLTRFYVEANSGVPAGRQHADPLSRRTQTHLPHLLSEARPARRAVVAMSCRRWRCIHWDREVVTGRIDRSTAAVGAARLARYPRRRESAEL
jgi:hypothetical protein